jgi:hypothetical protein
MRLLLTIGLSGVLAAAQSAPPPAQKTAKPYTPPKTSWGDPDLQGIWPGNMGVPMQRALNLGTRTELTDAEFKQREEQNQRQLAADAESTAASDTRVGIGPPSYWTERGKPTKQTSLIVDPPNGRLPELTPQEQQLRKQARGGRGFTGEWKGEADAPDDLNLYYRCITRGLLGSIIPVVYNNGNQIVQAPGYVAIRNEMIHETRIIPLDGRPHVGNAIRSYMGDSRGHWEGNTLVIETTNFTDKDAIGSNGAGYPGDPGHHSASLTLIERLTRVDAKTINYEATVVDPETWLKPWTMLIVLKSDSHYQLLEYACHEGNYAIGDILSGARAEEVVGKK